MMEEKSSENFIGNSGGEVEESKEIINGSTNSTARLEDSPILTKNKIGFILKSPKSQEGHSTDSCGFQLSFQTSENNDSSSRVIPQKVRSCKRCGFTSRNLAGYRKHVISCWRKNNPISDRLNDQFSSATTSKSPEKPVLCGNSQIGDTLSSETSMVASLEPPLLIKQEPIDADDMEMDIQQATLSEENENQNQSSLSKKSAPSSIIPEKSCKLCGVIFTTMAHYRLHCRRKYSCTLAPPFICNRCKREFPTIYRLDYHKKHQQCSIKSSLGSKNSPVSFVREAQKELEAPTDSLVQNSSEKASSLKHEEKPTKVYECKQCSTKFLYPSMYRRHMKTHSSPKLKVSKSLEIPIKLEPTEEPSKLFVLTPPASTGSSDTQDTEVNGFASAASNYQCPKCEKYFTYPYRLKHHLNSKVSCIPNSTRKPTTYSFSTKNSANTEVVDESKALEVSLNKRKVFYCDICNISFTSRGDCYSHCIRFHGTATACVPGPPLAPLPMSTPPATAEKWQAIRSAITSKIPVKNIKCPDCPQIFKFPYLLNNHKEIFHPKIPHNKPIGKICICPFCEKAFLTPKARSIHMHQGHKEYPIETKLFLDSTVCNLCKFYCHSEEAKIEHDQIVHKKGVVVETTEIYQCVNCSLEFKTKRHFNDHVNRLCKAISVTSQNESESTILPVVVETISLAKEKFFCEHCHMKFSSQTLYKAHINRFCQMKPSSYSQKNKGLKQELFGLDDKVFLVCEWCNQEFNQQIDYNLHIDGLCRKKPENTKIKCSPRTSPKSPKLISTPSISVMDKSCLMACETCDRMFINSQGLSNHRKCCQRESKKRKLEYSRGDLKDTSEVVEKIVKMTYVESGNFDSVGIDSEEIDKTCTACKNQFPTKRSLSCHKRFCKKMNPKFIPKIEIAEVEEESFDEIITKGDVNENACSKCTMIFPNKRSLSCHRRFCGKSKKCSGILPIQKIDLSKPVSPKLDILKISCQEGLVETLKQKEEFCKEEVKSNQPNLNTIQKDPNDRYICTFCSASFSSSYILNRHTQTHTMKRPTVTCKVCSNSYSRSEQLTRHMQTVHPNHLKFQCRKCKKRWISHLHCIQHIAQQHRGTVNKASQVIDLRSQLEVAESGPIINSKEIYIRKSNGITSYPASESNNFAVFMDTPGRGIYSCKLCGISNMTKMAALRRHWKTKTHKDNLRKKTSRLKSTISIPQEKTPERVVPTIQEWNCSVCNELFSDITLFIPHRLSHFNAQLSDAHDINLQNPYSCEICSKTFTHHQRVQGHFLWHLKEDKFPRISIRDGMIHLPKTVKKQRAGIPKIIEHPPFNGLMTAKKSIGGGTPTKAGSISSFAHVCRNCFAGFESKQRLGSHIRHHCTRRFNCSNCCKCFPSTKTLTAHRKSCRRSVSSTLNCCHCLLQFTSANDLMWHQKICQKVNESVTEQCIKQTSLPMHNPLEGLDNHMLQCLLCKENLYRIENLSKHFGSHPEEAFEVVCLHCDKSFNKIKDAQEHLKPNKENEANDFQSSSAISAHVSVFNGSKKSNIQVEGLEGLKVKAQFEIPTSTLAFDPSGIPQQDQETNQEALSTTSKTSLDVLSFVALQPEIIPSPKNNLVVGKLILKPKKRKSTWLSCPSCRIKLNGAASLKRHSIVHKPFTCPVCGKIEITTVGFHNHGCLLTDGTFATGIQHGEKWKRCNKMEVSPKIESKDDKDLVANFSQLMFLLIADAELMANLGWGEKTTQSLLTDVLLYLSKSEKEFNSNSQTFNENIETFLGLCVRDELLIAAGIKDKPIGDVVSYVLETCLGAQSEKDP